MDIEKLSEFVKENVPTHAEELCTAIDLLVTTVDNTKSAIDGTVPKLLSNNNYDLVKVFTEKSQEISEVITLLNSYINLMIIKDDENDCDLIEDEEEIILANNNEKIDYEKYRVDESIPYNIYTDFTYKKPAAFSIDGVKYEARQWKQVFLKTCELLCNKNRNAFEEFINNKNMQGKKRAYFSLSKEGMLKPKKVPNTNIFIETNLSANNTRNIIFNMLEKYGIPKSKYLIYLSKDLTSLHES